MLHRWKKLWFRLHHIKWMYIIYTSSSVRTECCYGQQSLWVWLQIKHPAFLQSNKIDLLRGRYKTTWNNLEVLHSYFIGVVLFRLIHQIQGSNLLVNWLQMWTKAFLFSAHLCFYTLTSWCNTKHSGVLVRATLMRCKWVVIQPDKTTILHPCLNLPE